MYFDKDTFSMTDRYHCTQLHTNILGSWIPLDSVDDFSVLGSVTDRFEILGGGRKTCLLTQKVIQLRHVLYLKTFYFVLKKLYFFLFYLFCVHCWVPDTSQDCSIKFCCPRLSTSRYNVVTLSIVLSLAAAVASPAQPFKERKNCRENTGYCSLCVPEFTDETPY